MSPIEVVAAALILINVWLVARRSIWNYAFGIAGTLIYGWVFYTARLYSDMALQGFFIVVQIYGWRLWARAAADSGEVAVRRLAAPARITGLIGMVVAILVWGAIMHRYTDASLPWWDAAIAMTSVGAQVLMSWRYVENWVLWIVTNIISIAVYAAKELWPTMALYAVLLALAVWGLAKWRGARQVIAA